MKVKTLDQIQEEKNLIRLQEYLDRSGTCIEYDQYMKVRDLLLTFKEWKAKLKR